MTIYARDVIKAGEPIYHSYARSFTTTTLRRVMLFSGKHFGCECVRCLDPTEMGSYCSALLCQTCIHRDKVPVLPQHPLDLKSEWRCLNCETKHELDGPQVAAFERQLTMELDAIERTDVNGLENFVMKYENFLHPNHASLITAKQLLSVGYGRFGGYEKSRLSHLQIDRKIELCREVYAVVQIVEGGIGTKIGMYTHLSCAPLCTEKKQ